MNFTQEIKSLEKKIETPFCISKEGIEGKNPFVILEYNGKSIKIWEDQWLNHKSIIESRISSFYGKTNRIHGRETNVIKINKPDFLNFLKSNHLNIPINAKHKYGLIHNESLIAVAGFSKKCPIDRNGKTYQSHELVRYCSLLNTTVVGGLSKLINHFKHETTADDLITQVDKEWSDGSLYKKLGFVLMNETPPQHFKLINNKRTYCNIDEKEFSNLGSLKYLLPLK